MLPHEINKISKPEVLAVLLNSGLIGVLSVQVLVYSFAFPNDRVHMKCLVYGIYMLESIQSVLCFQSSFRKYVIGFGDVEAIDKVGTAWLSVPILTAIDTFIVQGFYAHRISILAKSRKVSGAIIALSFVQLVGGIVVGVHTLQRKHYSTLTSPKYLVFQGISVGMWIVGSVLCDVGIALCMTYYLSRYDSTIKQTEIVLKKIIRLTIETGSLTAVIGIVAFCLAILPGSPGYYQIPVSIIGKVYANSMLVLINSRMLLGSEERSWRTISIMRFPTTSIDSRDNAIEAHERDLSINSEEQAGPSRRSNPDEG